MLFVFVRLQAASGQHFEDTLKRQLEEKRAQVLEFENSLAAQRAEVATLKGKLAASEEVRNTMLSCDMHVTCLSV